tara:strand:- start:173 stop:433 length:261 start_codon:yes stop_codon:yes gene_type:complete
MKCKKCKMESDQLVWDFEYNTNTGKWRLYDKNLERPHECSKPSKVKKEKKPKKVLCPKCDPQTRKPMERDKLQEHIRNEHIDWGKY